jgi:hypothetical protein
MCKLKWHEDMQTLVRQALNMSRINNKISILLVKKLFKALIKENIE